MQCVESGDPTILEHCATFINKRPLNPHCPVATGSVRSSGNMTYHFVLHKTHCLPFICLTHAAGASCHTLTGCVLCFRDGKQSERRWGWNRASLLWWLRALADILTDILSSQQKHLKKRQPDIYLCGSGSVIMRRLCRRHVRITRRWKWQRRPVKVNDCIRAMTLWNQQNWQAEGLWMSLKGAACSFIMSVTEALYGERLKDSEKYNKMRKWQM